MEWILHFECEYVQNEEEQWSYNKPDGYTHSYLTRILLILRKKHTPIYSLHYIKIFKFWKSFTYKSEHKSDNNCNLKSV